jgi:hypothetical protein
MRRVLITGLACLASFTARADIAYLQLQASTNLASGWESLPLRASDLTSAGLVSIPLPAGMTNAFFRMGINIMEEPVPPVNVGVRLTYFYAEGGGDPAFAPNPHSIRQAVSTDGLNFSNAVEIFSANDLVDPDVFRIAPGSYGLLVTDHAASRLVYARSPSIAGPYTNAGGFFPTNTTQSATIDMDGTFRVFASGILPTTLTRPPGSWRPTASPGWG